MPNAELGNWIPSVLRYGTISEAISSGSLEDFLLFSHCNEEVDQLNHWTLPKVMLHLVLHMNVIDKKPRFATFSLSDAWPSLPHTCRKFNVSVLHRYQQLLLETFSSAVPAQLLGFCGELIKGAEQAFMQIHAQQNARLTYLMLTLWLFIELFISEWRVGDQSHYLKQIFVHLHCYHMWCKMIWLIYWLTSYMPVYLC